jgi:hypothetical protein
MVIAVLLLLALAASPAPAAELRGQDDPRFQAALELWLADDDATALPEFAALAAGGNRAAQVLLARIDATPTLSGPWLAALRRAERISLMRAPGGFSGTSWMRAAAEDTPLAQLWLVQATPEATIETALGFAAMGEAQAARDTLDGLTRRQARGFAAHADDPNFPPDQRYLVWREWDADPATRARADAETAAHHPGDPQLVRYDFRDIPAADFADWLATAPLAAPLRAACSALCPASGAACLRAGFALVSGPVEMISGHAGLSRLGPPSETLVATEVWNASPRGRATLLHDVSARFRNPPAFLARVAAEDACFGDALAAETARFAN